MIVCQKAFLIDDFQKYTKLEKTLKFVKIKSSLKRKKYIGILYIVQGLTKKERLLAGISRIRNSRKIIAWIMGAEW